MPVYWSSVEVRVDFLVVFERGFLGVVWLGVSSGSDSSGELSGSSSCVFELCFIFLVSSLLTILLFRKWVKKMIWSKKLPTELEDEFIGKTGRAETSIAPGQNGKVIFKGTSWDARSEDTIETGEAVTIVGNESILLIVKSNKSIS